MNTFLHNIHVVPWRASRPTPTFMLRVLGLLQVVVFALGPGTTLQHAQGLVQAFESICNTSGQRQQPPEHVRSAHLLRLGARCMQQESHIAATPRHAMFTPTERYTLMQVEAEHRWKAHCLIAEELHNAMGVASKIHDTWRIMVKSVIVQGEY